MKGFVLIEVLLAAAISSVLGIILVGALYQINKAKIKIDEITSINMRAALVHYQVARDLFGAFIQQAADQQTSAEGEQKTANVEKNELAEEKKKVPEKESEKKPLYMDFDGTVREANLDLLTFITTNPLQEYWGATTGKPKPRIVRVLYRLVPDKEHNNSFMLLRKELSTFDTTAFKEASKSLEEGLISYAVITGVKHLSIHYIAQLEKKEQVAEGQKTSEKGVREFKTVKEWHGYTKQERQEERLPLLPRYIQMRLVLWDSSYQKEQTFNFTFIIPLSEEIIKQTTAKKPGTPTLPSLSTASPKIGQQSHNKEQLLTEKKSQQKTTTHQLLTTDDAYAAQTRTFFFGENV